MLREGSANTRYEIGRIHAGQPVGIRDIVVPFRDMQLTHCCRFPQSLFDLSRRDSFSRGRVFAEAQ